MSFMLAVADVGHALIVSKPCMRGQDIRVTVSSVRSSEISCASTRIGNPSCQYASLLVDNLRQRI